MLEFSSMSETVHRPWGSYTILDEGPTHKVKRIEVLPGNRLSYQRHVRRSEHWVTVAGRAKVVLNDQDVFLSPGDTMISRFRRRTVSRIPERILWFSSRFSAATISAKTTSSVYKTITVERKTP